MPARGYDLALIPPVPLPRSLTPSFLTVPTRMRTAVREATAIFGNVGADVVVGFGGYVALPAYLAARSAKLPFVVHEANAKPGLANRWGARFTPYVRGEHARPEAAARAGDRRPRFDERSAHLTARNFVVVHAPNSAFSTTLQPCWCQGAPKERDR